MYLPAHFRVTDEARIDTLLREHPLAAISYIDSDGRLDVSHIPMFREGDTLFGHIARPNPLKSAAGREVLAVFSGVSAYVSPDHYPEKKADGRVVPTWNYATVHVRGTLRLLDDAALHTVLTRLTDTHEGPRPTPWAVTDAPDDYVTKLKAAIIGVAIDITDITAKFKLSQNKSEIARASIAGELGDGLVAERE